MSTFRRIDPNEAKLAPVGKPHGVAIVDMGNGYPVSNRWAAAGGVSRGRRARAEKNADGQRKTGAPMKRLSLPVGSGHRFGTPCSGSPGYFFIPYF